MWAINLKKLVQEKLSDIEGDPLVMSEDLRKDEFTRNNHKVYKILKQLQMF